MRFKNTEGTNFLKQTQEIKQILGEASMPGLFANTLTDIERIENLNKYLSNKIRVLLVGELPHFDWTTYFQIDSEISTEELYNGKTLHFQSTHKDESFEFSVAMADYIQLGMVADEQPLLTVVIYNSSETNIESLRLLTEHSPWLLLLNGEHPIPSEFEKELIKTCFQLNTETINNLSPENTIWNYFDEVDVTHKCFFQNSINNAQLQKTCQTLDLVIKKESNSLISKKSIAQQKLNLTPDGRSNPMNELLQKLKSQLQRYNQNFEKSIDAGIQSFTNPVNGDLVRKQNEIIKQGIKFDESKKSKNIELSIEKSLESTLYDETQRLLEKKFRADLQIFVDTLNEFIKEIDSLCETNGIPFQSLNVKYITQYEVDEFIRQVMSKEIEYSGTAPNKGVYEYFSAARKFQMVFFMMASVFGVSGLIRKYQYISIPLSIALLGYGVISVSKSVAKEREENQEKEIKSAKDSIERWIKDLGNELSRNWNRKIIDAFKEQTQMIIAETESSVKMSLTNKATRLEEERKKQQKSIQAFEQIERKLDNIVRGISGIDRNLNRFNMDNRSAFNQSLRKQRDQERAERSSDRASRTSRRDR